MADAQLKKLIVQNDQLRDELKFTSSLISASEACEDLQSYCQRTKDPFMPDFGRDNPYIVSASSGGNACDIL